MKNLIFTFSIIFLFSTTVFAQDSKKEDKDKKKQEQYQKILDLVKAEKYEFTGRKANPPQGRQIDLTTRYNFLRINEENGTAEMPYFGRAFSGGYSSSDGGIKFDGPIENYDVQQNDKKRRITVKFKVKGTDDTYSCTLSISSMESASLSISSNKRQAISYNGFIQELSDKQ